MNFATNSRSGRSRCGLLQPRLSPRCVAGPGAGPPGPLPPPGSRLPSSAWWQACRWLGGLAGSGKPGGSALQARGSAYVAPPGQRYVFVDSSATFVNVGDVPATPAELRNAATGKVVKVLRPIRRGVSFTAAAAAPIARPAQTATLARVLSYSPPVQPHGCHD
jgi:hypothetical protein